MKLAEFRQLVLHDGWEHHPLLVVLPFDIRYPEDGTATDRATVEPAEDWPASLPVETLVEPIKTRATHAFSEFITIGRAANNDIVLVNPMISIIHALFMAREAGFVIQDRFSSNGTILNGLELIAGKDYWVPDNSVIRFGNAVVARFVVPDSALQLAIDD